jgi:hypothetical protein
MVARVSLLCVDPMNHHSYRLAMGNVERWECFFFFFCIGSPDYHIEESLTIFFMKIYLPGEIAARSLYDYGVFFFHTSGWNYFSGVSGFILFSVRVSGFVFFRQSDWICLKPQ